MADTLWLQDFFGKGELTPLMYPRVTMTAYYQALKTARNVLCYPQGAAGKRFGTEYWTNLTSYEDDYTTVLMKEFQYLDECCYILVFYDDKINIYLEKYLVATVSSTSIKADEIQLIDYTVLDNAFRVTTGILQPKDLKRAANAPNTITAFSSTTNTLTLTAAVTLNGIWPVQFIVTTTIPATTPQIHTSKTYFVRAVTTTTVRVFSNAIDAANNENYYSIASAGVATDLSILNTWTFSAVSFRYVPVFDFQQLDYSAKTFTPAAMTGYNQVLTASGAIFTAAYVGGIFSGNGGIGRIITYTDTTHVRIDILQAFIDTTAIPGTVALLAEPAWSATRLWPRKCSSYQNRSFFGNTELLPNGVWGSVINDYNDFDDSQSDDDSAISWFPTSDTVNYINFMVPYRSFTVHTNSGVYSTPLTADSAITPKNFTLVLQDSTPADVVQPRSIDNQIISIAGNDVYSLLWDGFNSSYTSSIVSIINEHLIVSPIDEAAYIDKVRAGSRYMLIVNSDGTLAIYQTLIAEDVSGFTLTSMEQSYGNAYFRGVASNFDGRAWFLIERQIATAITAATLSTYTPTPPVTGKTVFTAVAHGMVVGIVTACKFTTTGTLQTTTPQINISTYYWAVAITVDTFYVYLSQEDADAAENAIISNLIPANNKVEPWPLVTNLFIEQLNFDAKVDCAGLYDSTPTSSISGQSRFNAQSIKMQGDGYGFEDDVVGGAIAFEAHGEAVQVSVAQYGFPITMTIEPLPISIPTGGSIRSSNLVQTKHIRTITLFFADTIGGTLTQQGRSFPVALKNLLNVPPGSPPAETTGTFQFSSYAGFDDLMTPSFTLTHDDPFDIKLTGIYYRIDI